MVAYTKKLCGNIFDVEHIAYLELWLVFTKRTAVLPQGLVKFRKLRDSGLNFPIALEFGRHFCISTADMSDKFQSDTIFITCNLVA